MVLYYCILEKIRINFINLMYRWFLVNYKCYDEICLQQNSKNHHDIVF